MKVSSSVLLLLVGPLGSSGAFIAPEGRRTAAKRTTFALKVQIRPDVPPLPPPPPPPTSADPNAVDQALKEILAAGSSLQLPDLSTLKLPDVSSLKDQLTSVKEQLGALDASLLQQLDSISSTLRSELLTDHPEVQPLFDKLSSFLQPLLQSPTLALGVSAVVSFAVVNFFLTAGQPAAPSKPYPNNKYDPDSARAYFDQRLPEVIARSLEILVQSVQFGISLLNDRAQDQTAEKEEQRGKELALLLTRLGPTFIKVGQSLSIRTDLLSPAYIRGLATLQDQVPAFETSVAKRILEQEWGKPINDVLMEDLTPEPIAAASLGQVYQAKLRSTGEEVAIKVQRPNIVSQIALDMHLLREFGAVLKRIANLNTDTVGTVDAWGTGFVDELDYIQEAANGEMFSEQIKETPLKDVVFAPSVVQDYTTRSVLVTSWVDGERLDRSSKEDVTILCSIAMNTYLTMLLELGLLHCDPHPGNLLRTKDGKLCILDFGMVTRLSKDLQLTLIEHMAHLTSSDYGEVPRDLLLLGFVPEDKADAIEDSGVVDVLADIYGAWTSGGGAAAINVNKVVAQLQDLTAQKGNLFRIPPYFAYIAKSFSVLEGIGLSNDPKYSIINECLPYVSKRLLTDKEKMGPALSTFIFGPDKANEDRIVDYERVEQLVEGFSDYTTSASGAMLGKENLSRTELLEDAAEQVLDLVFTEEETPLQQIFLEQMAKIISASGRSVWTQLREQSGVLPSGRTRLGTIVDPLGLWRTSPLVRTNDLDDRTVETTRKLVELMQKQIQNSGNAIFDLSTLTRQETLELSQILVRKVWSRRSGVLQTSNRFARTLLQLTAAKLEAGERDTRRLPPPPQIQNQSKSETPSLPASASPSQVRSTKRLEGAREVLAKTEVHTSTLEGRNRLTESERLSSARKLLSDLQENPDDDSVIVMPEAVPVKTSSE